MAGEKLGSTRHTYMDVIRIIGCILVVLVHISNIDWIVYPIGGAQWKVLNVVNCLGMSGVPLFFMISGALFLHKDSKVTIPYVWKKIGILFLFYLLCLVFYNLLPILRERNISGLNKDFLKNILLGNGIYHLWFLPVLMSLYAIAPILKKAFATKKNCESFLILFLIFGVTFPSLLRYEWESHEYLESFYNRFALYWYTGQIGYFVLGHYLHSFVRGLSRKKTILVGGLGILTMLFIILCNNWDSVTRGFRSTNASTPMSLTCLIFVSCVFLFVKSAMGRYSSERGSRVLKYVASLSLGIYFIHPFVIDSVLWRLKLEQLMPNYVLLTLARILVVLAVSGLFAAVVKKIPVLKKLF